MDTYKYLAFAVTYIILYNVAYVFGYFECVYYIAKEQMHNISNVKYFFVFIKIYY